MPLRCHSSQLVPGNTGINTVGFADLMVAYIYLIGIVKSSLTSAFFGAPEAVGNTFSRVPVHAFRCLFHGDHGTAILEGSPCRLPHRSRCTEWTALLPCRPEPRRQYCPMPAAKKSLGSTLCSIFTPRRLPNAILLTASATPAPSTAYAEIIFPDLHIAVDFLVTIHDLAVIRQVIVHLSRW